MRVCVDRALPCCFQVVVAIRAATEGARLDRLQRKMISYEYLLDCVMFTDDPVLRVLSDDKGKQDQVSL